MTSEPPGHSANRIPSGDDPDPISISLAVLALVASGGSYLEARRQRKFAEGVERKRFEGTWRNARDGLQRMQRQIRRYEMFIEEEGLHDQPLRFGSVRLTLDPEHKNQVRALQSEILTTASYLTKYIDELSDHLGPEDEEAVRTAQVRLEEIGALPGTHGEVIAVARLAEEAYLELIQELARRHDFAD